MLSPPAETGKRGGARTGEEGPAPGQVAEGRGKGD